MKLRRTWPSSSQIPKGEGVHPHLRMVVRTGIRTWRDNEQMRLYKLHCNTLHGNLH
ncbi:hypothetical protein COCSUDRAFT_54446 [Coccomyxa subellipsoidea C-169]|uniref:Uncharacterized protein n=1 Tax=Coccomyxa subellipsoidea (strain C-169) TaxID=574566 RepID=I0YPE6_COCSC|nr:hypothetical protein COCSUDRAFT_54446 [Coccomyxa subellipsoidea C-169]EIE20265.1 hypothetical protein COCSUDRAFT_54446 [Coccomyxa subellipsoidea C-169]|eukprot:XP_005644809.1 hypothetical protein COCSUDRAFT_54446 [Coccomyxa subellipsoidea C-169]